MLIPLQNYLPEHLFFFHPVQYDLLNSSSKYATNYPQHLLGEAGIDLGFVADYREQVIKQVQDNPAFPHWVQVAQLHLLPEICIWMAALPVELTNYSA